MDRVSFGGHRRALSTSRARQDCAGKKFDRFVKRGVPEKRVCVSERAPARYHTHTRRSTAAYTHGDTFEHAYIRTLTSEPYIDLHAAQCPCISRYDDFAGRSLAPVGVATRRDVPRVDEESEPNRELFTFLARQGEQASKRATSLAAS